MPSKSYELKENLIISEDGTIFGEVIKKLSTFLYLVKQEQNILLITQHNNYSNQSGFIIKTYSNVTNEITKSEIDLDSAELRFCNPAYCYYGFLQDKENTTLALKCFDDGVNGGMYYNNQLLECEIKEKVLSVSPVRLRGGEVSDSYWNHDTQYLLVKTVKNKYLYNLDFTLFKNLEEIDFILEKKYGDILLTIKKDKPNILYVQINDNIYELRMEMRTNSILTRKYYEEIRVEEFISNDKTIYSFFGKNHYDDLATDYILVQSEDKVDVVKLQDVDNRDYGGAMSTVYGVTAYSEYDGRLFLYCNIPDTYLQVFYDTNLKFDLCTNFKRESGNAVGYTNVRVLTLDYFADNKKETKTLKFDRGLR